MDNLFTKIKISVNLNFHSRLRTWKNTSPLPSFFLRVVVRADEAKKRMRRDQLEQTMMAPIIKKSEAVLLFQFNGPRNAGVAKVSSLSITQPLKFVFSYMAIPLLFMGFESPHPLQMSLMPI